MIDVEERIKELHGRLDRHERRIASLETQHAVAEKSQSHMDQKFAELKSSIENWRKEEREHFEKQLSAIRKPLTVVVMSVILALISGIVTFILNGGMSVGAG